MSRRRHTKALGRRRRAALSGKWADAHPNFPWYGIGWGWHVFFIWPMIAYGISTIIRGPRYLGPAE